jgi:FkbM family methyltransferase
MLKKIVYSIRSRGLAGFFGLIGSYVFWYWKKLTSRERKFLRKVGDYQMYLNLDDPGLSTTIGRGGDREKDQSKVLQQELKEGMVVLDIGANLGYYALMEARRIGPRGKIYAVEPVPSNYDLLSQNIQLNKLSERIEAFPLAISNKRGKQKLFLSKLSNLNTLFPDGASFKQSMTGDTIEVHTIDLVSFLVGKRPVDLMRMDIEGAEVEVFHSLVELLEENDVPPKRILFETHRSKYNDDHSMEKPLRKLLDGGYHVKRLISNYDDGKKWQALGYRPDELIYTDGMVRGIYSEIAKDDAIDLICHKGGVRAALLEYRGKLLSSMETTVNTSQQR